MYAVNVKQINFFNICNAFSNELKTHKIQNQNKNAIKSTTNKTICQQKVKT